MFEVHVLRGSSVESKHWVHACAVDLQGKVLSQWGDVELPVFPRSSIKPLQAFLLVESGAAKAYGLSSKHLALASSSHKCEKFHLDLVADWMKKIGVTEGDLCCGGHWPGDLESAHEMIRKGQKPTPMVNNCSGKHTGLLTVCRHLGIPVQGYQDWNHPLQKMLRKRLSEALHQDLEKAPWGVDGCGIPTSQIPLRSLALGMAALLAKTESAPQKIADAMLMHPELVGGTEDFTSRLIAGCEGQALLKTGAEGVFAGVSFTGHFGFAVKAIDGSARASEAVTAYLLKKWGVLSDEKFEKLSGWTHPSVKNWKGDQVGLIKVMESTLNRGPL